MFIENKYTKWYFSIIANAKQVSKEGYTEKHHILPRCMGGSNDTTNIINLTAREHFICHLLLTKMVDNPNYKRKLVYAAWQQSRSSKFKGGKITSRTYLYLREQLSITYTGRTRKPFSEKHIQNMKRAAANRKKVEYTQERKNKLREYISLHMKGVPLSEKHKENISNGLKNRTLSSVHKEKISKAKIGKKRGPFNDEWKNNLSKSHIGIVQSDETKMKKSLAMKGKNVGKVGPNKGIPRTEEVKNKISLTKKNSPQKTCPHCGKIGRGSNMTRYHFDNCKLAQ